MKQIKQNELNKKIETYRYKVNKLDRVLHFCELYKYFASRPCVFLTIFILF